MQGEYSTNDLLTKLNSALSLAKIMPPSKIKNNLIGFINLAPEIQDNLMEKIQLPMQIDRSDPEHPFIKTQFNRDGDSYRSPYTNSYVPEYEGYKTTGHCRMMEETGLTMFNQYIKLYYGGDTVGNFYVMENQENPQNFSCGFFAKKDCQDDGLKGNWDSFNIVDVSRKGDIATYSLNSTILIQMGISHEGINLSGFLKKQKVEQMKMDANLSQQDQYCQHLVMVGEMIEDMETVMRQHLEAIYMSRTKQIIFTTRYENTITLEQHKQNLASDLKKLRFGE